jgi:hypothetical protein|nr:MAG TPA: Protein of unknown function (DUF1617) [Caudoviricetes sp.]
MKYSNRQLEAMAKSLGPVLKSRSFVGYKAAVNMRAIMNALADYTDYKDSLIREYGTEIKDDDGNVKDFAVTPSCDGYQDFLHKLNEVSDVEHDVQIMAATPDDVIGVLSGEEIIAIDWMMEHEEG